MKRILAVVALVLSAAVAHAQVDRATLSGTVKDESGGVLSTATVVVTNVATKVATRVQTNTEGSYFIANLIPGQYVIEVQAPGFQTRTDSVIFDIGQRGRIDFALGVSGLTETVTVSEARRLLSTEQAALGTVVDQNSVSNLPLAIRNWDDLLALVPGVQGDRFTEQGGGTSFGRTGGVNVHGNRSLQNNFLLDGVDNNSISTNVQELTAQVSRPSIDSIQEFKVVTSPYSAEYGRSPGAAISVTTKSGTNEIHGTVYDFYRNERFDANDFFSKRAGADKPANDQNQFGANLGGPILKDKAFFFVDYEGTRIKRGVIRLTRVPTADDRRGVFAGAVRDPLTGQPFPNNTIPTSRIDPVAAAMLALIPEANQSGSNNFFRQPDLLDDSDRVLGRVDYRPSDRDSFFARYIHSTRARFIPGAFGGVVDGTGTSGFGDQSIKSKGLVVGYTRIFSAATLNEFRFSWMAADSDAVQEPFGQAPPPGARVPGVPIDPAVDGGITGVNISGFFGGPGLGRIGSPDFLPKFQRTRQFEVLNTLSHLRGNHQLKFGFNVLAPMKNEYLDIPGARGTLTFNGQFSGNAFADFLLGYVQGAQLTNVYVVDQRHWATSFFMQDDWKVNPKLSLNLGLRYDFITPALEAQNRQTNFVPEGGGRLIFASDGSLEDRGLVNSDKNNFAPRLGIVYKATEKTVLRGGYGIFYNLFDRIGSEDQLALNPPGLANNSVAVGGTSATPIFLLRDGFPASFRSPINLDPAAGDLRRLRIRAVSADAPKTTIHQFSAGAQRQIGEAFVASVDFVGSYGKNLARLINLNQPPGGSGPVPYPNFGFIEWRDHTAESSYKGMDLSLERRFTRGYSFGVAYTLSEARDEASEHLSASGSPSFPQDARNPDAWEGPSDFDVRHRFVTNFVAELPFGEGKKWANDGVARALLGDWMLSGIFTARTGRPFTVRQSNNNVGQGMTGLPNQIGDPEYPRTVEQWFNPAAFARVPSGTFGNVRRNTLRGPGWKGLDLSLARKISFSDRVAATVRWDVFNVFDTVNLGLPNSDLASSSVGTISSLAGDPRLMQFSLRLGF